MRHVLTCLLLCLFGLTTEAQKYQLRTGKAPVRMTDVVLMDGYVEGSEIEALAHAKLVADYFIDQPLWTNVLPTTGLPAKESWDAVLIFKPSLVAGTSYWGRYTNATRYGCTFNFQGYSERLMAAQNSYLARIDAASSGITSNILITIVANSTIYGGSGGSELAVSRHGKAGEIGVHEAGHTFAHLGDEYSTAYPGYPDFEEPNTTREPSLLLTKWYSDTPTHWEGAHYHVFGWFRPELDCEMRTLDRPFCKVCTKTMLDELARRTPVPEGRPGRRTLILSRT
jgi:hypothetical protein